MKYESPRQTLDSRMAEEGDPVFTSLNMKLDRGMLPAGTLARSENKRLRKGTADTRFGVYPADFLVNPRGWVTTLMGSCVYSDPNGQEQILMAQGGDTEVWSFRFDREPFQIRLGGDQTIPSDRPTEFVQAFDQVLLLRGNPYVPMIWNGDVDSGFELITKSDPDDTSTKILPNVFTGEPYQNRLLFPFKPITDRLIMSDALDYSQYDHLLSDFRINAGKSDYIVRIYGYMTGNPSSVLIFMGRSIHLLSDFSIDPLKHKQEVLNTDIGAYAPKCFVQVGGDIMFLSRPGGIYKVSQLISARAETTPIPISDPIQPIIERITWQAAHRSVAALLGEYAYFAVPIDGALFPNVILVFNTATNEWESIDRWNYHPTDELISFSAFHVTDYEFGQRRLFAVDYLRRRAYIMYEGLKDRVYGADFWIKDTIETRGYGNTSGSGPGSIKNFKYLKMGIRTLFPIVNVTAISDGQKEEKLLTPTPIVKFSNRWYVNHYPQGLEDPNFKREDYANVFDPQSDIEQYTMQDFDSLPAGPVTSLPAVPAREFNPMLLTNVKQDALERKPLRMSARWVSIRVENTRGICDVLGVGVESLETTNVTRVAS